MRGEGRRGRWTRYAKRGKVGVQGAIEVVIGVRPAKWKRGGIGYAPEERLQAEY